jgi:hypothetical protein
MAIEAMKSLRFRAFVLAAAWAIPSASAFAQAPRLKGEFSLLIGAGFSRAEAGIVQRQGWTSGALAGAAIENAITIKPRPAFFLGGAYTNFFDDRWGIQLGFGYLKTALETQAEFRRVQAGIPSRRLSAGSTPSEITAVPFYAALAWGWKGERIGLVLTAGPAVILHSILIETPAGTLLAAGGSPAAYQVSAGIADQTWVAAGGILGAVWELKAGPGTAVAFDIRYLLSPMKKFAWTWTAGTAVGLDDPAARASFDAAAAQAAAAAAPRAAINPSSLQLTLGIKFFLDSF